MNDQDKRWPDSLRERKKAKTRYAIQQNALRLFQTCGYDETTMEQVADAAEVSPSTVFRYFPTKEDLVLLDDYDPLLMEIFRKQSRSLSVFDAIRNALNEFREGLTEEDLQTIADRSELIYSIPRLRDSFGSFSQSTLDMFATLFSEYIGASIDDFEVKAFAAALHGVMTAASAAYAKNPGADYFQLFHRGIDLLESGFSPETVALSKSN